MGLCSNTLYNSISTIVEKVENKLFKKLQNNPAHTLHQFLPPMTTHNYNLRTRPHNRQLVISSNLQSKTFLNRFLYKNTY